MKGRCVLCGEAGEYRNDPGYMLCPDHAADYEVGRHPFGEPVLIPPHPPLDQLDP